jgi:hypothetical protein
MKRIALFLAIAIALVLVPTVAALADTGVRDDGVVYTIDTTPPVPDQVYSAIDNRCEATGEYYNYDTGEFLPADAYSLHEGEADDPYPAASAESLTVADPAGTYVLPDGLKFVLDLPNGVPTVWW